MRVRFGGGPFFGAPPRLPGPRPLLGPLLPRGVRLEREPSAPVQPPPGPHDRRLHLLLRILYATVQDQQVLPQDLREAAAHDIPRAGHTLHRVGLHGGLRSPQPERSADNQLLQHPLLDGAGHHGAIRHTVRGGFLQLPATAVLRQLDGGVPRLLGAAARHLRADDLRLGGGNGTHWPHADRLLQVRGRL